MFFCFCLKGGWGYSLKEQRVLFSLLHSTTPGGTVRTIRACMDPNPVMSAIGAQKALLGEVCPGAAPKKTPRSFRGNKGSGWRQPQLLCFSLIPETIKCSPYISSFYSSLWVYHGSTDSQLRTRLKQKGGENANLKMHLSFSYLCVIVSEPKLPQYPHLLGFYFALQIIGVQGEENTYCAQSERA